MPIALGNPARFNELICKAIHVKAGGLTKPQRGGEYCAGAVTPGSGSCINKHQHLVCLYVRVFGWNCGVLCTRTAGSDVSVHMKIHHVEGEEIKFETSGLHLSRQDELAMWATYTYQIFESTFSSKLS